MRAVWSVAAAHPRFSVTKHNSFAYGIYPRDVESWHTAKAREVSKRAVIRSIRNDRARVLLGQSEGDELLSRRRVDVHEPMPLGEKRQKRFKLLPGFQLRAFVDHVREHALPAR